MHRPGNREACAAGFGGALRKIAARGIEQCFMLPGAEGAQLVQRTGGVGQREAGIGAADIGNQAQG